MDHSKTGKFINYYWNELAPKARKSKLSDDEDFDESIALELGKVLISLYDR